MKHLLRYFISATFIIIAFISGTCKADATIIGHLTNDFTSEVISYYVDSSPYDPDLYLPRQISYVNLLYLKNKIKRTNNVEFVKTGKISNTSIRYSIQKTTLNIPFSFTKTAHRLIRLGKLII